MNWFEDWQAISCRIRSLLQAGQLHALFLSIKFSDSFGGGERLFEQTTDIFNELESFHSNFEKVIPVKAREALERFSSKNRDLFTATQGATAALKHERVKATLTMLAALDSEVTYLLSDNQENIRRHSERAFTHLQRLIIADPDTQQKWFKAFEKGETFCEKLGAAHLLQHGIWAFKAHAEGARTDLVFGDLMSSLDEVVRSSEGLVLTEWKCARTKGEAASKFKEARDQANLYGCGMLAGIELTGYRYIIVISGQSIETPQDIQVDGVIYRHVNIAVKPNTPSKAR